MPDNITAHESIETLLSDIDELLYQDTDLRRVKYHFDVFGVPFTAFVEADGPAEDESSVIYDDEDLAADLDNRNRASLEIHLSHQTWESRDESYPFKGPTTWDPPMRPAWYVGAALWISQANLHRQLDEEDGPYIEASTLGDSFASVIDGAHSQDSLEFTGYVCTTKAEFGYSFPDDSPSAVTVAEHVDGEWRPAIEAVELDNGSRREMISDGINEYFDTINDRVRHDHDFNGWRVYR